MKSVEGITPYNQGVRDSIQWEPPACPYGPDSTAAGEWGSGWVQGRKNLAHNVKAAVGVGMTARWISESVSSAIAMSIGQALLPMGGEMLIYFRCGFIMQSFEIPLPDETVDHWVEFAMMVNRTMQGRAVHEIAAAPRWINRLAREQALQFIDQIMKGAFMPREVTKVESFQANLRDVFAFMGGTYEPQDWLPRRDS